MKELTALLLVLTATRGQSLLHGCIFITHLDRQRRCTKKLVVRLDPNALEIEVVSALGLLTSCSAWETCSSSVSGLWHLGNIRCPGGPRQSRWSSVENSSSLSCRGRPALELDSARNFFKNSALANFSANRGQIRKNDW